MTSSRRDLLKRIGAASAGAFGAGIPFELALAQGAPIKLGSILDNSGNLDTYGKPMVMATTLAVEQINAAGGLLGRQVQLTQLDTQSDMALYTQYAQQLVRGNVDVVHGGITSASREAIRQILRRAQTLYFYNMTYEGGVCDRNVVCTGPTPGQTVEPIVEVALKEWGQRGYILAADYNYGQITAKWISHYIRKGGGQVVDSKFFPLDVADFGSTIAKIQQDKPSFVITVLVGGAHMSFYRQWAAAGMNKRIPMCSTTFGTGGEQLALSPAEGDGILIAGSYSQEADTPTNKEFLARWARRFGDTKGVHELAVAQYQGVMLWAACVRKAGSLDRAKMLSAIESGISIAGPTGTVGLDPRTHHCVLDIKVMEVKNQKLTIKREFKARAPTDTAQSCDLLRNPNDNRQYEVKV